MTVPTVLSTWNTLSLFPPVPKGADERTKQRQSIDLKYTFLKHLLWGLIMLSVQQSAECTGLHRRMFHKCMRVNPSEQDSEGERKHHCEAGQIALGANTTISCNKASGFPPWLLVYSFSLVNLITCMIWQVGPMIHKQDTTLSRCPSEPT